MKLVNHVNLVILESDRNFAEELRNYFSLREELCICGTEDDGEKGLSLVEKYRPEILIVSSRLLNLDGFTVMNEVKSRSLAAKVIALCDKGDDKAVNRAYSCNVDYCFTTPVTANKVGELVAEFVFELHSRADQNKEEELNEKITIILVGIGIRHNLHGFDYLRAAIRMAVNEPSMRRKITGELYPAIGREFGTTKNKVERGIRTAIDKAWDSGNMILLNGLLGYECIGSSRPTNSELICMIADKLSREVKKSVS